MYFLQGPGDTDLTPRQVKMSASLRGKQETWLHPENPWGTPSKVVLATAIPQLSQPIQLSELGWELSFSGAAWEKVGHQGWPEEAM